MMKYRPNEELFALRLETEAAPQKDPTSAADTDRSMLLRLRWLRSCFFDGRLLCPTVRSSFIDRCVQLQEQSRGCSALGLAERLFLYDIPLPSMVDKVLPFIATQQTLAELDVRGLMGDMANDDLLSSVSCPSSLRVLRLPWYSSFTEPALSRFSRLEELEVTFCPQLTTVAFCAGTLRELRASQCVSLTDAGLHDATRLEVLHVVDCPLVTSIAPFAHCLKELDASGFDSRIQSTALTAAHRLQVLYMYGNTSITTLEPFVTRLRELNACASRIGDTQLRKAGSLVMLDAALNYSITTVAPFKDSLRVLLVAGGCLSDQGFAGAVNLVTLNCSFEPRRRWICPPAASLLELTAPVGSMEDFHAATSLVYLDVREQPLPSLHHCASTLRHLHVGKLCGLTDKVLKGTTQLVALHCSDCSQITTVEPFASTLREITCSGADSGLVELDVSTTPHLHTVSVHCNEALSNSLLRQSTASQPPDGAVRLPLVHVRGGIWRRLPRGVFAECFGQ